MVSTRKKSSTKKTRNQQGEQNEAQRTNDDSDSGGGIGQSSSAEYEQLRLQRIEENMQRMKDLGILQLSKKLKPDRLPSKLNLKKKPPLVPSSDPPRRSSRLKDMSPVNYSEKRAAKEEGELMKNVEIHIEEGTNPEVYSEEHEKLLGDCKSPWTLLVDGFDENGVRVYDPVEGKSCHQCRQKTLGLRTKCSKCKRVTGQFCGDCLYMRYGENVTEANENLSWICPPCRGICNCSNCRRHKGWKPTGAIFRKVRSLGFKSVAHYLIQTRRSQGNQDQPFGENLQLENKASSADSSLQFDDKDEDKQDEEQDSSEQYELDGNDSDAACDISDGIDDKLPRTG